MILGRPEQPGHSPSRHKNTTNNEEPHRKVPRSPDILLIQRSAHSPRPALLPPRILRRLRAVMPTGIKMINRIPIHKRRGIIISRAARSTG